MSDRVSRRDFSLPLLIGLAALFLSLAFQSYSLVRERSAIAAATAEQGQAISDGDRTRVQLETLLSGANDLAKNGNAAAAGAMVELGRQGIGYTPPR